MTPDTARDALIERLTSTIRGCGGENGSTLSIPWCRDVARNVVDAILTAHTDGDPGGLLVLQALGGRSFACHIHGEDWVFGERA